MNKLTYNSYNILELEIKNIDSKKESESYPRTLF